MEQVNHVVLEPSQETLAPGQKLLVNPLSGLVITAVITLILYVVGSLHGLSATSVICLALSAWLAFENGGNDVSKGIAPLVSSKIAGEKTALVFGTVITFIGSWASLTIAKKVMSLFTSGIISPDYQISVGMVLAIAGGAAAWVCIATRFSMPVSTTHALIGAIVAVGVFEFGVSGVLWSNIGMKVVGPLLFSPVVGLIATFVIVSIIRFIKIPDGFSRISTWFTCGGICFVRSVNDTPKIVAIASLATLSMGEKHSYGSINATFLLILTSMALGSILKGLPVTKLLAKKVTKINNNGSLASSLTSVILIANASGWGLPVSTTHVSTGSILGAGIQQDRKGVNWKVVRDIGLSWVITLPSAGIIGIVIIYLYNMIY
ncbi:inorganic phosphate transporter [Paenibacillus beijingensis]|uniref:Phosphate transporter n=1 Tax=Paenibacillus beijingensis TaxID=1126833 RepID=A0A0D5NSY8_9BACL|nr:inorganic phosphate transporter [Paenibacillus beijingensis]AJY78033.1 hypothetical protein VN24_25920 [Paenibacillus beijingensis]